MEHWNDGNQATVQPNRTKPQPRSRNWRPEGKVREKKEELKCIELLLCARKLADSFLTMVLILRQCPHVSEKENEVQRSQLHLPRAHSFEDVDAGLEFKQV